MGVKIYTCPQCGQTITHDENAEVYQVVIDHLAKCPGTASKPAYKRITDVVPSEVMAGNIISVDSILDREVLVTYITWKESTFKEDADYLSLTVLIDGEEKQLNTGAERVVQVFKAVDPAALPIYCAFEKIQLPNGRRVYRVK